jgi:quinol monooxygenase YgiN
MTPVTYFIRMRALGGRAEEVQELLLSNVDRIRTGEPGNLAFGVHRAGDDPDEFWLYETWVDADAVEAHESGPAFRAYREALRPLVDPDSVQFGNTEPMAVLGYPLPADGETLAQRFIRALGCNDAGLIHAIYDPDVSLYTPLGWPISGVAAVKDFIPSSMSRTRACGRRSMTTSIRPTVHARAFASSCTSTTPGASTAIRRPASAGP